MNDEQDLILYGNENNSFGDKICALILALAPLLQHYKGIVENAGFTVLILITPILLLRTLNKLNGGLHNKKCFIAIIPLVIFFFYTILDRDFNGMLLHALDDRWLSTLQHTRQLILVLCRQWF